MGLAWPNGALLGLAHGLKLGHAHHYLYDTSTHHVRWGYLGIGDVIQYCCIQVTCYFGQKMVSNRGVLLLKQMFWHLNNVQFGWVLTSSAKYCHPLNFKPDYQSSLSTGLNFQTGPVSSSARCRFGLWFGTKLWHHCAWLKGRAKNDMETGGQKLVMQDVDGMYGSWSLTICFNIIIMCYFFHIEFWSVLLSYHHRWQY